MCLKKLDLLRNYCETFKILIDHSETGQAARGTRNYVDYLIGATFNLSRPMRVISERHIEHLRPEAFRAISAVRMYDFMMGLTVDNLTTIHQSTGGSWMQYDLQRF
jgi:hypothetical protein